MALTETCYGTTEVMRGVGADQGWAGSEESGCSLPPITICHGHSSSLRRDASASGIIRKDPSAENQAPGFVRILLNEKQVWPTDGWAEVSPSYDTPTKYGITGLHVSQGDKLRFIAKHNGQNRADPIVWNPSIIFEVPDSH